MPGWPLGMNSAPTFGHGIKNTQIPTVVAIVNSQLRQRVATNMNGTAVPWARAAGPPIFEPKFARRSATPQNSPHKIVAMPAIPKLTIAAATGLMTSVNESTTKTAHANGTKRRCSSAHGRALPVYHLATASKPRWTPRAHTGTAGLRFLTYQRPAKSGVSVNE